MGETARLNDGPKTATTDRQRPLRPIRLLYAVGAWVGLVALGIGNAILRERVVAPAVGDYWAHVASTGTLITALAVVVYLYFRRYPGHSERELVAIALLWPVLTVLFEFLFGHYVMGHPWSVLLADYNLLAGRVWVLVPLSMAVLPLLFGRDRER